MKIKWLSSFFLKCVAYICILAMLAGNVSIASGSSYRSDDVAEVSIEPENVITTAADLGLSCKACVLMEATTGTIIYSKDMDTRLSPASITKIMTLLLIFEALDKGQIKLEDQVTTSAYAKSMGGSQVFLEEGERQSVETMIKCIVIASGNDASVAMAEYIAGTEIEFVNRMNAKAKELGMKNTNFEDCCGLSDSDNHYTSAKDVAIMSRELITKYPQIYKYSTIWMENITHTTNKGTSEFGLSSTNKLLKQYEYATGLKTGSTSKAKYCVSATANKDNIELIAVVMASDNYKKRFSEAESLFNYGYGICRLYKDNETDNLKNVSVKGGVKDEVSCSKKNTFSYLSVDGTDVSSVKKVVSYEKQIVAPIKKGTTIGKITYMLGDTNIGTIDIVAKEDVPKAGFSYYFQRVLHKLWL